MTRQYNIPPGVGADLKSLRESSELSQKQVQRASGLDQSRISRIEKGEVVPSVADLNALLSAMKPALAKRYKEYLRTAWTHFRQPHFSHPGLDALARAESCLRQIDEASNEEGATSPVKGQLQMYRTSLVRLGQFLEDAAHALAFIGPVGVGKSTVISHISGLLLPARNGGLMERCALEVSGGRTTLCEVQVKQTKDPRVGLSIEPQAEEEVHTLVSDLCAGLLAPAGLETDDQRRGVASETETALRNMAGLGRKHSTAADKKRVTTDPLRDLAAKTKTRDELHAEICTRMNIARRTRRELWHEGPADGTLEWLKKTFSDVNRGRLDDVPLPRRIDVLLPRPAIDSDFDVTLVDTKGIDDAGTAIRPDLELRLTDPRTICVLCSSFADAPNAVTQQILSHLRDVGETAALRERLIVLVLPQNEQALDVADDGARVESKEHGYEVKERQAIDWLQRHQVSSPPPFAFYNAMTDETSSLIEALRGQISRVRGSFAAQVNTIADNVALLLADKEKARAIAAQGHVLAQLSIFIERHETLPSRRSRKAHSELLRLMRKSVHHSVLWATTRRRGRYTSFDVYFRLGAATAADANERSNKFFIGLEEQLAQWKADPDLDGAAGLVDSLSSNLEYWRGQFLDACRRAGEETFRPPLLDPSDDADQLWRQTEGFYGSGGGYRDRVADEFGNWFEAEDREDLHDALDNRVHKAWRGKVLSPLRRLCVPENGTDAAHAGSEL